LKGALLAVEVHKLACGEAVRQRTGRVDQQHIAALRLGYHRRWPAAPGHFAAGSRFQQLIPRRHKPGAHCREKQ
jgi:hypothetical protein